MTSTFLCAREIPAKEHVIEGEDGAGQIDDRGAVGVGRRHAAKTVSPRKRNVIETARALQNLSGHRATPPLAACGKTRNME
jgi:hypothetical protein